jgi:hypothetical protein
MNPTRMSERDPLATRLAHLADGEARRTSAWPGLDGAVRRERQVRAVRRGTAGALAASLAIAITLPFTPIRVAPLDDLAATVGLIDRGSQVDRGDKRVDAPKPVVRQDVSPTATTYRQRTGEPLPAKSGEKITDDAWLGEVRDRAIDLLGLERSAESDHRPVWAADDGTWVRAAVQYSSAAPSTGFGMIALTGRTGSKPSELRVSGVYGDTAFLQSAQTPPRWVQPGTLAFQAQPDGKTLIAQLPDVDASGTVDVTWHEPGKVATSLAVMDLQEASRGWIVLQVRFDGQGWVRAPLGCLCGASAGEEAVAAIDAGDPARFLASSWLGRYADLGHAAAGRDLSIEGFGAEGGNGPTLVRARIGGVRTPGGGWLVSGDLTSTANQQNVNYRRKGARTSLPVVAAPAPADQGTPLVGVAPTFDGEPTGYVLVWAPHGVTRVRSGELSAPVVDGVALLDLRRGGRRVDPHSPRQAVLVEGLDAAGAVVARTRVNEPDDSRVIVDDMDPDYVAPSREDLLGRFIGTTNRWEE